MNFTPLTDYDLTIQHKFNVYLNYIVSLSDEINSNEYFLNVFESKELHDIKSQNKKINYHKVSNLLRIAWATEVQLSANRNNTDLTPYANHWSCVQAYYSVYLTVRSLLVAMNHSASEKNTHRATIDNMNKEISKRPELFPYPWKVLCVGNPNKSELITFINTNNNEIPDHTHNSLKRNIKFIDRYGQFLKTTRKRIYDSKRVEFLHREKLKRLPKGQEEKIIDKMSPSSLLDCLFRLRVRSNYEDSDIFMPEISSNNDAYAFNNALQNICNNTLLVFEIIICAYVKKDKYKDMVENFSRKHTEGSALIDRMEYIFDKLY